LQHSVYTVIPQPWLQASSASESGNTICTNYSLEWINNFLSSSLIDSIDSSQAQTNVFPRQAISLSTRTADLLLALVLFALLWL
jgi:hypothetical protein